MNIQNWSGWHWLIVGLGASLVAEKSLENDPVLAPYVKVAEYGTTTALTIVGLFSQSAAAKKS